MGSGGKIVAPIHDAHAALADDLEHLVAVADDVTGQDLLDVTGRVVRARWSWWWRDAQGSGRSLLRSVPECPLEGDAARRRLFTAVIPEPVDGRHRGHEGRRVGRWQRSWVGVPVRRLRAGASCPRRRVPSSAAQPPPPSTQYIEPIEFSASPGSSRPALHRRSVRSACAAPGALPKAPDDRARIFFVDTSQCVAIYVLQYTSGGADRPFPSQEESPWLQRRPPRRP